MNHDTLANINVFCVLSLLGQCGSAESPTFAVLPYMDPVFSLPEFTWGICRHILAHRMKGRLIILATALTHHSPTRPACKCRYQIDGGLTLPRVWREGCPPKLSRTGPR